MEDWNTRTKVLVVASLFVAFAVFVGVYVAFFNGPNKAGGHNIAVYLEGQTTEVDVYSSERGGYLYKNLKNGQDVGNILNLTPDRIGRLGGTLRFESKDWDRSITITFEEQDQQLIRNVIQKSTGLSLRLYIYVSWQNKLSTSSGWSIMIHAGDGD